jgi:hypothetical protein
MDQSASFPTLLQDRYQLQTVLQERDHTTTWVALDRQGQPDQQSVIVKILEMGQLQDWQAYELFEREALALKSLNHPGIPRLIDFFQAGQQAIVVQQHINGETLRARMDKRWKLTEAQARALARQALEILNAVHSTDPPLVHRDLKPENIMLDNADRLYIIDFGAVRQSTTTQHTVAGSFAYMAPEQLGGNAIPASDLYGLGMTLIELLSGSPLAELPREGLYVKFHEALNVSEGFKRWLDHMIAPYAVQRFASAQVALEGLEQPEYLAVLEHRKTLSPSHGKQALSPFLWIQEKPDALTLEINSEKFNMGQFLRALVWAGFFVPVLFTANYYLMGWFSDALVAIPELKGAVTLRDILGVWLSIIGLTLIYLWIHKRYVGVVFSPTQTLHLDDQALTFTFFKSRGLRKPKKKVRIYPLQNLRGIRFHSHHLAIELHRPQRGFRTHVITPQTSFSKPVRETLVEVTQKRGVSARV